MTCFYEVEIKNFLSYMILILYKLLSFHIIYNSLPLGKSYTFVISPFPLSLFFSHAKVQSQFKVSKSKNWKILKLKWEHCLEKTIFDISRGNSRRSDHKILTLQLMGTVTLWNFSYLIVIFWHSLCLKNKKQSSWKQ